MTTSTDIDGMLSELDFAALNAVIARATELRDKRHAEAMEKLQHEASALGATIKLNGQQSARRGRRPKHHDNA